MKKIVLMLLCILSSAAVAQTFHFMKNPMGIVHSSAADAKGTIYIGAGAVYATTDSGANWTRLGLSTMGGSGANALTFTKDGKPVVCVDQAGIKILQPGNIWTPFITGLPKGGGLNLLPNIRTITRDSAGHFFAGSRSGNLAPLGMFFASDTGAAWTDISSGLPTLEVVAMATGPSGTVYCAPDGYGIYKYTGSTWTSVNTDLIDLHVQTIAFDASGAMIVGTTSGVSVLKSTAASWINYTVENSNTPVLSLAVDPTQGGRIFAGLGFSQYQAGPLYGKIYVSNDSGKTWSNVTPPVRTLRTKTLTVAPNGVVYAGAQGMFRSTDHGVSWSVVNNGLKETIPSTIGAGFAVTKNDHFLEGSEYGIWRSTDQGQSWTESSNGIRHPLIEFLFRDSLGYLFACAHALPRHESSLNRLYRSTDDGLTWDTVKVSFDGIYSMIAQGWNNDLYLAHGFGAQLPNATFIGSGCARSTDRGATWVDLPCFGGKGFSVGMSKKGTLFFGGETYGLFRSTDKGASWDTTIHIGPGGNVAPVCVSPRGEIVTCAYGDNRIWFSDSAADGKSYVNMTSATFPMYTSASTFTWSSTGRMYVGLKGNPPNTGLYYVDGPLSASSTFVPVPNIFLNVNKFHWDDDGYLWIYGAGSLVRSDSVLTAPRKPTVVQGRGATPAVFRLDQNFPNPFNPTTAIRYQVSAVTMTSLTVYDMLGREAATLVNEVKEPGAYTVRFDASGLASGIYYYTLRSGSFIQTRRMLLLK